MLRVYISNNKFLILYFKNYRRLNGDIEESNYFLPRSMVKINNNGMVQYSHRIKLNSYCLANLVKWPFDSHNCTFYIGSPYFTNIQVIFSFPDGYYVSEFIVN